MTQEPRTIEPARAPPSKGKRIHWRTFAVVLLVVVVPWTLVAIPKTKIAAAGTTGSSVSHSVHGWPFVHLESTNYRIWGDWVNGTFIQGKIPAGLDLAKEAKDSAAYYTKDKPEVRLNLRIEPHFKDVQSLGEEGYWSNPSNWPTLKTGNHLTPRFLGLLLNLICLAFLAATIAAIFEYRIRRHHRLLKFSLANLLLGTALLAAAFAWIAHLNSEYCAQKKLNDSLQAIYDSASDELVSFDLEYESRFSLITSQLLNHGKHPWGAIPFFRQIKSGRICVSVDDRSTLKNIKRIAELSVATKYPLTLRVMNYSPARQNMLKAMDGAKIVNIDLDFHAYSWLNQKLGDKYQREEARQRHGFKIDLGLNLEQVETIRLELNWTLSPKEQLPPFIDLPSLKAASITELSTEGAQYILDTKNRWPKAMKFSFQDDVPDELISELEATFDASSAIEAMDSRFYVE